MSLDQPIIPSHDAEAERALLGSVLICPSVLSTISELVGEQDFYDSPNREIFGAMSRLWDAGRAVDNITVTAELKRVGALQQAGGSAAIAELIQAVSSAANVMSYCRIVREKAQRRVLRRIGYDLSTQAYDEKASPPEMIEQTERSLLALDQSSNTEAPPPINRLVFDRLTHLEKVYKGQVTLGIPTGLGSLDGLTGGLQPGSLNVIGARPSMGKTGLAITIAAHVALNEQRPVHIFSLEMSKEELTDRLLSQIALVDLRAMHTGKLTTLDWSRIATAAERLSNAPLSVDDNGSVTITQLRRRARRAKAKTGMALMIVDYLQLMSPQEQGEQRQQQISDISRGLKLLAKELSVPIIALSQLNRKVEDRPAHDRRPVLSDLRESGAIEQDADLVGFIYRDEVYNPATEDRGLAEILVRKQRNGPIGEIRVLFREQYAKFENLPHEGL